MQTTFNYSYVTTTEMRLWPPENSSLPRAIGLVEKTFLDLGSEAFKSGPE